MQCTLISQVTFAGKPFSSGTGIRATVPGWLTETKLGQPGLFTGLFNLKPERTGLSSPLEHGWQAGVVRATLHDVEGDKSSERTLLSRRKK